MDPIYSAARLYIHEVQTTLSGDGREIFDEFRRTLKQFRRRSIDSSIAISTVQKLFQNHPDLLDAFKPFVPINRSASAASPPPEDSSKKAYVDFLKRVCDRFGGGGVCSRFFGCMHAYARGEIGASDVCEEVVGLLGEEDDLVGEFMRFVPENLIRERSRKRKTIADFDRQREGKRGRRLNPDLEIAAAAQPRTARRRIGRVWKEEEKAAKRIFNQDNEMEDSLCEIDVKIGNLKSVRRSGLRLLRRLLERRLSPDDVRLDEHFSPLNLACIGRLDKKLLECIDEDPVCALLDLIEILMMKKEALEKEREKIVQKWDKIRKNLT